MPPSDSQESLTLRTSWLVVGKTLAFALTVAIPLLLVRRMPREQFGLYKQTFLVINSAINILPLGFSMTAFYYLAREEEYRTHTVFNIVLFTTAVATLCGAVVLACPAALVLLFKEPSAAAFSPWIAGIIVLWVVGSFLEIVTVANQEIRLATTMILGIQATRAIFFVAAAAISGTIRALLLAAIAQGVVQVLALFLYLRSRFPRFWRAFDVGFLRRQVAYALPFGAAGLLYSLQLDLHSYFVSHQFGAATYAVYSIGCFQLPLFGILSDSVGGVLIPRISRLQHRRERREIVLVTARAMRKLALAYFPAYAFLLVMRREFIIALFTARYLDSIPVFAINLTLIPLGVLLLDPIMRAHAEHRRFLVKLHAALLVGLAATLPFALGRFGLVGAITAVVMFNAAGRAVTLMKVATILDVGIDDLRLLADVGKVSIAAAGAALTTALIRPFTTTTAPLVSLTICGVAFTLVYATVAVLSGVVTVDERAAIKTHVLRATGRVPGLAALLVPVPVREER
ncbi:MAG TPA: oligosaccharide flippase family protein [Vicinamibacterales bacterium]|nr:oligosaccharide flippase family protein [Vicinamibacterales bacterium]